jgi:hypothetical protein
MIFGGSQIRVATQPIFDKIATLIKIGIGLSFNNFVMINVTGTTKTIVVTLSKNIESPEVSAHKAIIKYHKFHPVFFAVLMAKYWKNHVFSNSATISIIPNRSKIVLKSIELKIASDE